MHFLIAIVAFKIALILLVATLGAMFIAEFFPIMADKAVVATNGTVLEMVGEWLAAGLRFVAKYAQIFVNLVFDWLRAFGIEIDRNPLENVDMDAPKNIEKPEF